MRVPLFDRDELAGLLEEGLSVEAIARRVGRHPSTVSYWMEKFGFEAPLREKHAAKGGLDRDELVGLIEEGLSISEIAARVGRSKATVRYWMRRHDLKTARVSDQERAASLVGAGLSGRETIGKCETHGETTFVREGRGYFRCKACRSASVMRHRRKVKEILVQEAGGRCAVCGYDRNIRALEFHHLDPKEKRHALSGHRIVLSLAALRAEAGKCVLLCSNCHAEVEDGALDVPLEFQPDRGRAMSP